MKLHKKAIRRVISLFGNLRVPFLLIMLILFLFWLSMFMYIKNQTEFSPIMVLHKEIANDCYPSVLSDSNGNIHVVWQSEREIMKF